MPKLHPSKKDKAENEKRDPAVTVAIVTLAGTIITAILASPVLMKLLDPNKPTPVVPETVSLVTETTVGQSMAVTATPAVLLPCPENMVLIPAGPFLMGAVKDDLDAQDDEKPQVKVTLDAYCIDKTEVSNMQYFQDQPAELPSSVDPQLPVVNISWFEANAYCQNHGYDLPTEAQWEKAARGDKEYIYPWGNTWEGDRANFGETTPRGLHPVSDYPGGVSPYGIFNMVGNAAEWVADWYQPDWYHIMPHENPFMSIEPVNADKNKVIRGGAYVFEKNFLRISARVGSYSPDIHFDFIGFRCAAKPHTS